MSGFLPETVVGSFCCASESFGTFVNATYIQVLLLDFCFMLLMGHPGIPCSEMRKKKQGLSKWASYMAKTCDLQCRTLTQALEK